jgi:hypothetical protein
MPSSLPGALHTNEDFTRIKAAVTARTQPWFAGWEKLINNSHASLGYTPAPVVKLIRGGKSREEPEADSMYLKIRDWRKYRKVVAIRAMLHW